MNKLIPSQATHRVNDLLSKESSDETKGSTARWYAEMIIKEFLADEFSATDAYQNFSLGELIAKLTGRFDRCIIDSLNLIKNFGDRASHYNSTEKITKNDARKAVEAALGLYPLIIIDHLKKHPLSLHPDRATLLSTTLPEIRLQILDSLVDFNALNNDEQLGLLHKWCLACVKCNRRDKARHKLKDLLSKKRISDEFFDFETKSINEIALRMKNEELPIPRTHEDFVRNFIDVESKLDARSKEVNSRLIGLLDSMCKNISPSEMGNLSGMQVFIV